MIIIKCGKTEIYTEISIVNVKMQPQEWLEKNFCVKFLWFTDSQNDLGCSARDQTTKEGHGGYGKTCRLENPEREG